jgi:hypothetical protein
MPRIKIDPAPPDQKTRIEIAQLRGLDLRGLQARWKITFRKPAPLHLPRHLLFGVLAYRLQADALGDLDAATRPRLNEAADQVSERRRFPT